MEDHNDMHPLEDKVVMPRREFIRKSLIASGGAFVGMSTLGNFSLPQLGRENKPDHYASDGGRNKDKDKDKDKNKDKGRPKGGRFGGNGF